MKEAAPDAYSRSDRINQRPRILVRDLLHLSSLLENSPKLPQPDRNYIVVVSKRDPEFPDHETSNTDLRRQYVIDNLGIDIGNFQIDDYKLKGRLVGEIAYLLVSSAIMATENPSMAGLLVKNINASVRIARDKYSLLQKTMAKNGFTSLDETQRFYTSFGVTTQPNDDPLPPRGLRDIWEAVDEALAYRQAYLSNQ